jgi:hypothetical protein
MGAKSFPLPRALRARPLGPVGSWTGLMLYWLSILPGIFFCDFPVD